MARGYPKILFIIIRNNKLKHDNRKSVVKYFEDSRQYIPELLKKARTIKL